MSDETTPQDSAAMSPASAGSLAWIPVSERLPGKRCRVLVSWRLTGHITIAWFRPDKKRKRFHYEVDGFNDLKGTQAYITHWMPLPAPPAAANKGGGNYEQ